MAAIFTFGRQEWMFCLALGGLVAAGCAAPGQRLLEGRVEVDGDVVLKGMFGVSDSLRPDRAWTRLKGRAFEPTAAFGTHVPDQSHPRLKGKVRIVLEHTGRPFATVDTMQLDLLADPNQPGHWQIAPAEVDRTAPHVR